MELLQSTRPVHYDETRAWNKRLPKGHLTKVKAQLEIKPHSLAPNDGVLLGVAAAVLAAKHLLDKPFAHLKRALAVRVALVSRRVTRRVLPSLHASKICAREVRNSNAHEK